ncbi:uncharacterized protein LOC135350057 isoform X2 [Halichondria panicea]
MDKRPMKSVSSSTGHYKDNGSEESQPLISGQVQVDYRETSRKEGANEVATFFNFAKASIGSGSFALSWGILKTGVILGSAGMVLLGIASVYTMQLMLDCKRFIERRSPSKSLTYTQLGWEAMGPFGKWAVNISVLGCNLGVCAGYMIFISSNLQWSFSCLLYESGNETCFTVWEVYAMILPILILLTYLPSFKILAYAAYVGSVFLVVAMVVVYVFGGQHGFCAVHDNEVEYLPSSALGLAQWFGVTAFLFCVHSMVIPLESTMKRPKNMPVVLDSAALTVVVVNLPFALYGYLMFGSGTEGYIFENLPGGTFNDIVRILLSIELTLTFPIVIKPATDVMEEILHNVLMYFKVPAIKDLYESKLLSYRIGRTVMVCALRTILVLVSWGVAVGIPRFELCLALVGSLATTVLAFVLPPMFHLALKWRHTHIFVNVFHIVLLACGIMATLLATSINLYMAIIGGANNNTCGAIHSQCQSSTTENCVSHVGSDNASYTYNIL